MENPNVVGDSPPTSVAVEVQVSDPLWQSVQHYLDTEPDLSIDSLFERAIGTYISAMLILKSLSK